MPVYPIDYSNAITTSAERSFLQSATVHSLENWMDALRRDQAGGDMNVNFIVGGRSVGLECHITLLTLFSWHISSLVARAVRDSTEQWNCCEILVDRFSEETVAGLLDILYHIDDAFAYTKRFILLCIEGDEEARLAATKHILDMLEASLAWDFRCLPDVLQILLIEQNTIKPYTVHYGE
ncbi:hypothetical protein VNI00_018735 [Paramarasmius palmivorus]|uniref:BTB/POZ domain-containing protein n=1 Tax=Paramarasmius palmivorus TaxID=297713 RepID=A0AAW0AWC3_9AGAR